MVESWGTADSRLDPLFQILYCLPEWAKLGMMQKTSHFTFTCVPLLVGS